MAGLAISPAAAAGNDFVPSAAAASIPPSLVNAFRIAAVVDRLAMHVRSSDERRDVYEFYNLCLSLARGIDFAVANNEVPARAQELPLLLKEVCQRKNELFLQAAIMVLMISVKNACKLGWFSVKDTSELLNLANEIGGDFCSSEDISVKQSCLRTISKIMSRFYPRMKMGKILASLEVKPGFGAFVVDFHISKNTTSSPQDKIRLFVAQTDNIETSSCIISPPQVNFLLNGKGVERRTTVSMEIGPQIPTNVTAMLKFGTNLLQAVGQFNGHYIIAIAFMSVTQFFEIPTLQDYVRPVAAALDTDMEVIEGASRISLNCPISAQRIKTPVKGHSCKHLQCFDFGNFVDINLTRPSWRCPHCNQSVCYTNIRIDQSMFKVLREVGQNVAHVIISADGSWEAVLESDDPKDQPHGNSKCQNEGSEHPEVTIFSNAPYNILDLTEGDDEMDSPGTCDVEDRKPCLADLQCHSVGTNLTMLPELNYTGEISSNTTIVEDDYWAGIFVPAHCCATSSGNASIFVGISETSPANTMLSPVLTDAISPALNREAENTALTNSFVQNQLPATNNLQLQPLQFGQSLVNNQYGRLPTIPGHVSRTPIAVQALPAQPLTPGPHQRSRIPIQPFAASRASPSIAPTADGLNTFGTDMERQQQYSRLHVNPVQMLNTNSPSLPHHPAAQNWNSFVSGQSVQQVVGLSAPNQLHGRQNAHLQQPLSRMMPHALSPPPNVIRPQFSRPRTQIQQEGIQAGVSYATSTGSNQRAQLVGNSQQAAQRIHMAAQMTRQAGSMPLHTQMPRTSPQVHTNANVLRASVGEQRGNTGGAMQPASRVGDLVDLTSENWRPTGRMRGQISGQAFSELSQYIIRPTQPTQAAQPAKPPPIPSTSLPASIPPQLQAFLANSGTPNRTQTQNYPTHVNYPMTEAADMTGGSGVLPEPSQEMH